MLQNGEASPKRRSLHEPLKKTNSLVNNLLQRRGLVLRFCKNKFNTILWGEKY
jgi:hypothetical protein